MAALNRAWLTSAAKSSAHEITLAFANVAFSRERLVALLIALACATEPRCLCLGLLAVLGALFATRALRLHTAYTPYGYNALLCGVALAREFTLSPTALGFALALGALSVLVTAALSSLANHAGQFLPVLSAPFVLTSWFALGASPQLALTGVATGVDVWGAALPHTLTLALQSLGAFVLVPNVLSGALVLTALLVHSRIASVLAATTVLVAVNLLELTHAPLPDAMVQVTACSAALTAIAIGGIFLVPSRAATWIALASAVLAGFFALGFVTPLHRLGLTLSFVPFNAAAILLLSALRQRVGNPEPRLAVFVAETPEQQLLNHIARPATPATPLPMHLPFYGAWTCTQGAQGTFTHRGLLSHAYDFEIYSPVDGSLCGGTGMRAEDYYCFHQPVIAAADGIVVAIENATPNNSIGESDQYRPWGNYVVVQHGPALFSLVAHLSPGTVTVYPGQYVARGTVVGYCGNSGRSPRPHLHFQLQTTAVLGSATLPCEFSDVVVYSGAQARFEVHGEPRAGETFKSLQPDYALSAYFALREGATFRYKVGARVERITSEIDVWGRTVLRSLDRRAELVFVHNESRFSCLELRGASDSVLRLVWLALGHVPFERNPALSFRTHLPVRWLGGWLRGLFWDLKAAFVSARGIELHARMQVEARGVAVIGESRERGKNGVPLVQTRALLTGAPGPSLIQVTIDGRSIRAELVQDAHVRAGAERRVSEPAAAPLALGLGEWS